MAKVNDIITLFHELSEEQQNKLIHDLYNYSKDIRLFLESRLGIEADTEGLINEMERETIGKIYKKGIPGTPSGKRANEIISKAKKAQVPISVLLKLEQLAYRGFIEYLNEFGGGPDNFDEMACKHLEAYLNLIKTDIHDKNEQDELFEEVRQYLKKLDNMITDYVDDTFEITTGISVRR
ncbi:MAG: hypothetical protein M1142_04750 [Patescibacteria group bacterium]|nr:hypothetical protein [Patescibacteria group bacterium]